MEGGSPPSLCDSPRDIFDQKKRGAALGLGLRIWGGVAEGEVACRIKGIAICGVAVAAAAGKCEADAGSLRDGLLAFAAQRGAVVQRQRRGGTGAAAMSATRRMIDTVEHGREVGDIAAPCSDLHQLTKAAAELACAAGIRS